MPSRLGSYAAIAASLFFTYSSGAKAQSAPPTLHAHDLSSGIFVVNSGQSPEKTSRELAHRVYSSKSLKPSAIDDQTARVLIGEPIQSPSSQQVSFAEYRAALRADDAATRTLLSTICSELGASAALLVYSAGPQSPRAKLFIHSKHSYYPVDLWPQPSADGVPSWASAVAWLEANAAPRSETSAPKSSNSIFRSSWLWGAVGAAVVTGFVVYASSRDDSSNSIHLQGRVAP